MDNKLFNKILVNKKIILILILGLLILTLFGYYFYRLKQKPLLEDLKLFIIHPDTKQLKPTNVLTPKDDFLITFRYYGSLNEDKLRIFLQKNSDNNKSKIYEGMIDIGDNELCCFIAPTSTGPYKLIFELKDKQLVWPFIITEKPVSYDFYHLSPRSTIPYPKWQVLDIDLINRMITNIYYSYSKKLSEGFIVLLAVQDENNSRFIISQRVINNYKNVPFGNIVQDILKQENEALLKANIITDYKILEEQYENKEIYLKVRTITNGISYIIFNKTYETTNLLNQKVLINVSLSCPEKLVDFYQPIANYIFEHIEINPS